MTSLDVQNNAATLLESQTGLLQSKLTYLMKCRLVDYYKGQDIIRKQRIKILHTMDIQLEKKKAFRRNTFLT